MEHWEKVQQQRKNEADIIAYRRKCFEDIMEQEDIGLIAGRALALIALQEVLSED